MDDRRKKMFAAVEDLEGRIEAFIRELDEANADCAGTILLSSIILLFKRVADNTEEYDLLLKDFMEKLPLISESFDLNFNYGKDYTRKEAGGPEGLA